MGEKNVKIVGFTATQNELKIIDDLRKENYRLNKSEAIRLLINAGAEHLRGQSKGARREKGNG